MRELEEELARRLPRSYEHWQRASRAVAGGTSHDAWNQTPFAVFAQRGHAARKLDLDGREMLDFWMGHGALLFGHAWGPVIDAIKTQAERGTHLGPHPLESEWAEHVQRLVPSAERVRFVSSGSEAVALALRIARAFTGRQRIARLAGHFHGWHDVGLARVLGRAGGVPDGSARSTDVLPDGDIDAATELLRKRRTAAVLLEPGGGSAGTLPASPEYLRKLRALATATATVLIFDEVVSGFRYAAGGAQSLYGVTPDLTTLAKILCGGLPGGAVAGRADVMGPLAQSRLAHTGTFNANPMSAAAGIACLSALGDGGAQTCANAQTATLVAGVNARARDLGVDVRMFATSSVFHVLIGPLRSGQEMGPSREAFDQQVRLHSEHLALRTYLLLEGLDMHPVHGWVSAVHTSADIEQAVTLFGRALSRFGSERRWLT